MTSTTTTNSRVVVALGFMTAVACAHPISLVQAFARVSQQELELFVYIYLEDIYLFQGLEPNALGRLEAEQLRNGIERHGQLLLERFAVRDAEGVTLSGKVMEVTGAELPPEGVPVDELMAHQLGYRLIYALETPPAALSFTQSLVDKDSTLPSQIELWVMQAGTGQSTHTFLSRDQPYGSSFSWDLPPPTAEAPDEDWAAWRAKKREESLGITNYSEVYSFLYVEDHEVRHEILVPLLTLEEDLPVERADSGVLTPSEQEVARKAVAEFFATHNPVTIDGIKVQPTVDRVDFFGPTSRDLAQRAEPRSLNVAVARLGVILSYSTMGSPGHVQLEWDWFNRTVWRVTVARIAYEEVEKAELSSLRPSYEWTNPGRPPPVPLTEVDLALPPPPRWQLGGLSLILLGLTPVLAWGLRRRKAACRWALFAVGVAAILSWPLFSWEVRDPFSKPTIDDESAGLVLAALHKNVYRAFDYRQEGDVYDALARSVTGHLLRDLYRKIHRSLKMQEQGGAVARVQEVTILEGSRQPPAAGHGDDSRSFGYRCRWTVSGTVEHWGHIHQRVNEYQAQFTVEPREGAWKITAMDVLDEKRLGFQTTLRGQ